MKLKLKNQDFQEAATAASVVAWLVALYHENRVPSRRLRG